LSFFFFFDTTATSGPGSPSRSHSTTHHSP